MEKKDWVVKSREIGQTQCEKNLTKLGWDILNYILFKFRIKYFDYKKKITRKSEEYFLEFTFLELKEYYNWKNNRVNFRKTYKKVLEFAYWKTEEDKKVLWYIFQQKKSTEDKLEFKLYLNKEMISHFCCQKDYLHLDLKKAKQFKSKYTFIVYFYIKSRSTELTKIQIRILDFKKILAIPKTSYANLTNFKKRVIEPIRKDLKQTDLKYIHISTNKKKKICFTGHIQKE